MKPTIRTFDDPILKQTCAPIEPGDDLSFTEDMRRVCRELEGAGLAAPQVGVAKRVVLIRPRGKGGESLFMVNPVIMMRSKQTNKFREGCLSYPKIYAMVERHNEVTVMFYDVEESKLHSRQFSMWEARVVQHEIDHLDGICKVGDAWRSRRERVA